MKKNLLQSILLILLTVSGFAQKNNFWSVNNESKSNIIADKSVFRQSYPTEQKLFNLNLESFKQELFSIVGKKPLKKSTIITLPNAAGNIEEFEFVEASNFEPALQAKFPELRAYSGKGITDRSATVKLSISPQGIQTMVFRTEKDNEFIEPYSKDHTIYSVYSSHREKGTLPWNCSTEDRQMAFELGAKANSINIAQRSTGDLKTMRLAQSVTAEYSNYFGATSASQADLVLAAINNTLTRCNGVYEKDLAVHLNLIAATTNVIYYNPATDPYSSASRGAGGAWNKELQNTLTSVIGEANYDIGHLFGASGGGGNAGCIGCICSDGSKGSGFTSPADGIPQGDNFDIDYVVHEVGHQMGANHTFSMNNEGTGANKEVGSGITIMGYAGITNQDVAPHSIDIYHEASIAQIQSNLGTRTCPITSTITNATPSIAALTSYTIPISTPFALTGSATDADSGDVLTYCWEQNDNASSSQTGTSSVASETKTTGPNWLSFSPTTSPTRYFPKLSTILAGNLVSGPLTGGDAGANTEALSSVERTLNFRLTVRDNAPYSSTTPVSIGQTNYQDMAVTVSATSGPFAISAPNSAVSWTGGSSQTVSWAVAGTTASPVSCANVKISLSTDGGQTFPVVLISNTPNDGTEVVTIPNTPTTAARIKVEAVENIFFDISNANFTIIAGAGCGAASGLTSSAITSTSATVSWAASTGAVNYDVDYKLSSNSTWTNAATATTATSADLSGLTASSVYDWRVRTNCAAGSSTYTAAQFTTAVPQCEPVTGLASSSITTTSATVSWTPSTGAVNYDVDYKLSSNSTWTNAVTATTATSADLSGLTASSVYDWRVKTNCQSGTSTYTAAQFTTAIPPCVPVTGPLASSSITTTSATVSWTPSTGAVNYDVDYKSTSSSTWINVVTSATSSSASITGLTGGTAYDWRVRANCSNATSDYTMAQFTTSTVTNGCQSSLDNSTNDNIAGAATIPFNTNVTGLISTGGDIDNYKFDITTSGTINVSLTNLPSNYDLKLLNSVGKQVAISKKGGKSNESINYNAAKGTYYAQVYGTNTANNANSCYTLNVQLGTATRGTIEGAQPIVSVYPNPVSGEFKIDMGTYAEPAFLIVTDMYGRTMMSKTISGISSINTSKLAAGMYLITITDKSGVKIKQDKMIKE